MDLIPTTTPRLFCFVLMPFDEAFDDIYQLGIKASCEAAGAYCERVDEQIYHERILDRIYNQISKADFLIADMTGRNPNVFYEVGYAHAIGKPTILLTQKADDIPFDLKHFPHIVYESRLLELREQLTKRVRWVVENPQRQTAEFRDDVEVFVEGNPWTRENSVCSYDAKKDDPQMAVTLRNISPNTLQPGSFKVAFIVESGLETCWFDPPVNQTALPDGRRCILLPDLPVLFPDQYETIVLKFFAMPKVLNESHKMTLRLFTTRGPRDYEMTMARE